jgi:hypothetical protein
MKKRKLKLHKTNIVNLTQSIAIKGGTDDTMTECLPCVTDNTCIPDGTCIDFTDDITNENNGVPTFSVTVCISFSC